MSNHDDSMDSQYSYSSKKEYTNKYVNSPTNCNCFLPGQHPVILWQSLGGMAEELFTVECGKDGIIRLYLDVYVD